MKTGIVSRGSRPLPDKWQIIDDKISMCRKNVGLLFFHDVALYARCSTTEVHSWTTRGYKADCKILTLVIWSSRIESLPVFFNSDLHLSDFAPENVLRASGFRAIMVSCCSCRFQHLLEFGPEAKKWPKLGIACTNVTRLVDHLTSTAGNGAASGKPGESWDNLWCLGHCTWGFAAVCVLVDRVAQHCRCPWESLSV